MYKKGIVYDLKCLNCGNPTGTFTPSKDVTEEEYRAQFEQNLVLCPACSGLPTFQLKQEVQDLINNIAKLFVEAKPDNMKICPFDFGFGG